MLKTSRGVQYDRACVSLWGLAVLYPRERVEITTPMNGSQPSAQTNRDGGHRRAHVKRDDITDVRRPSPSLSSTSTTTTTTRPIRESASPVPAGAH
jgi:hypothetical protein